MDSESVADSSFLDSKSTFSESSLRDCHALQGKACNDRFSLPHFKFAP